MILAEVQLSRHAANPARATAVPLNQRTHKLAFGLPSLLIELLLLMYHIKPAVSLPPLRVTAQYAQSNSLKTARLEDGDRPLKLEATRKSNLTHIVTVRNDIVAGCRSAARAGAARPAPPSIRHVQELYFPERLHSAR